MPLSGELGMHATLTYTAGLDLGTATFPIGYAKRWALTSGVGANQSDIEFTDQRTVASGATDDLDLTGTALKDAYGTNIALVKVKAVLIEAAAANTTNLTVGNATAPFVGWFGAGTHTIVLKPGDFFMIASPGLAGWGVTATTADILRVTNAAGASANYTIIVIGTSA
jgi:hypothetical protein